MNGKSARRENEGAAPPSSSAASDHVDLPRVAAMVAVHNGGPHLRATLESLVSQDYRALTIWVVDDASYDDSAAIGEQFAAKDRRVRLIRRSDRLGWIGNSNELLASATSTAEIVFFAPQDDLFEPNYVSELVALLVENPSAVLAFAHTVSSWPNGEEQLVTGDHLAGGGGPARRGARFVLDLHTDRWIAFRGLVWSDAARRAGPMSSCRSGEFDADGRWLFSLSLLGSFVNSSKPLCRKVNHDGSLSRTWRRDRKVWVDSTLGYIGPLRHARLSIMSRTVLLVAIYLQVMLWFSPALLRRVMRHGLAAADAGRLAAGPSQGA